MNAVDLAMFEALGEAADSIAADKSVRAVVLRGAGGNFCAGIDLSVLANSGMDFDRALETPVAPSAANIFQRAAYAWRELDIPVICAIEGVAYGAGMQIALGADIRFAAKDATFSIMESKWGIIPDMGITTTLRHLVGPDRVKELSWSARILSSAEAEALGLITAVTEDPVGRGREFAEGCASKSPDAIRGIKALVNEAWHLTEGEALAMEARLQSGIIGAENQLEAVAANLGKRKPEFRD
jgi:enoyl-CoA hydratase/carnithine racemase